MTRARDISNVITDADFAGNLDVDGTTNLDAVDIDGAVDIAGNLSVDGGTIKLDGNYPTGTSNVALGDTALDSLTSGGYSVAIGNGALTAMTSGNDNVAVGQIAMTATTTGSANVAIGQNCMQSNTEGGSNVAVGALALDANTTGANHVAIGYGALGANTTASNNTAVGSLSLDANTTGTSNVALGRASLTTNTTGSNNVGIGVSALEAVSTGGSNTAVGNNSLVSATGSNNTAFGNGAGSSITSGTKSTIVGSYNGNQGSLDIRTTNNNIVISDGDGNPKMFHTTAYGTNGTFYISNQTNSSYWPKVATSSGQNSVTFDGGAGQVGMTSDGTPMWMNRNNADGDLIKFYAQGNNEGNISVSGTTVTYGGGHLGRWSQLSDGSKDTKIVKGTVMTNLDQMCVWKHEAIKVGDDEYNEVGELIGKATEAKDAYTEDNEQLNCMAVSNVEGDANVAGVFVKWDNDDDGFNDMMVAMTGDMVIRIAQGTTVARGDLLMSAGDGTAKPQGDDIVRSKTIAKVTSTNVSHTYDDGTYLVPCVLMAC